LGQASGRNQQREEEVEGAHGQDTSGGDYRCFYL
jgi:hypothetical protein